MAYHRYCTHCAKEVKCREVRAEKRVMLYCPDCEHRLGTNYGHTVIQ